MPALLFSRIGWGSNIRSARHRGIDLSADHVVRPDGRESCNPNAKRPTHLLYSSRDSHWQGRPRWPRSQRNAHRRENSSEFAHDVVLFISTIVLRDTSNESSPLILDLRQSMTFYLALDRPELTWIKKTC